MGSVNVHEAKTHFSRLLSPSGAGRRAGDRSRRTPGCAAGSGWGRASRTGARRRSGQVRGTRGLRRPAARRRPGQVRGAAAPEVRVLIDTQCWLWMCATPERLSRKTQALLLDPLTERLLSVASIWELTI